MRLYVEELNELRQKYFEDDLFLQKLEQGSSGDESIADQLLVSVFQVTKQFRQIQVVKTIGLGQLFDIRVIREVVFQEDDSVDTQLEIVFVEHLVHHFDVGVLVIQALFADVGCY